MGHGASVYQDESVLPSSRKVVLEHQNDRYRLAMDWADQLLDRERKVYAASSSDALYVQPLIMEKMERSLSCLDVVALSYGEDQQREQGHAEEHSMALSGTVNVICPLGDDSTVACAAEDGLLWVYNWREGRMVSNMRNTKSRAVTRLCTTSNDHRYLAAGDKHGDIELWDLSLPGQVFHERLHEQAITGLQCDSSQSLLLTTSASQYITIYDLARTAVAESANAKIGECGYGVPNSMLGFSELQPKIMLVGGRDGKLRVWSKGDGPMTRLSTIDCLGGQPHQCQVAPDGWRIVLGTIPADPALGDPEKVSCGGLLTLDLRCLGGGGDGSRAIVSSWDAGPIMESRPNVGSARTTGVVDMTLYQNAGKTHIMSVTDNMLRAFTLDGLEIIEEFEFDARAAHDRNADITALASCGRCIFVGTSTPSLGIWRLTHKDEPHGHEDFTRESALPPLLLRATCTHLQEHLLEQEPGAVLARLKSSLEQDETRFSTKLVAFSGKT